MTDLAVLAAGFGVIPLAAIILYTATTRVLAYREAAWGFLAGVLGFLGVSHAMAVVLVNHSLLGDLVAATVLSFVGLAIGAGIAWLLLDGPFIQTEPNKILWAAVAFLALHSFGDGLVLGGDFTGAFLPTLRLDAVTVTTTIAHRFAEGCLVVVPAIWAAWRPSSRHSHPFPRPMHRDGFLQASASLRFPARCRPFSPAWRPRLA